MRPKIHHRSTDARAEQAGYVETWLDCPCGDEVVLDRFTNACDGCGREYNMSGQMLAPREQWGEETGELAADLRDL